MHAGRLATTVGRVGAVQWATPLLTVQFGILLYVQEDDRSFSVNLSISPSCAVQLHSTITDNSKRIVYALHIDISA